MSNSHTEHPNSIVRYILFLRAQDLSIERAEKLARAFTQLWASDPKEAKQKINEYVSSWSQVLLILQVLNSNLNKVVINRTHPGLYTFIISLIATQFITEWNNRRTTDIKSDTESDTESEQRSYPDLTIINKDWDEFRPCLEIYNYMDYIEIFHWCALHKHYKSGGESFDDSDHRNFTREFLSILHDMMKITNQTDQDKGIRYCKMLTDIAIKSNRPVWWKYHRFSNSQILTEYKKSNSYWFEIMYNRLYWFEIMYNSVGKTLSDDTNIMCLPNCIIERICQFLIFL